jgi:hypothetical protein
MEEESSNVDLRWMVVVSIPNIGRMNPHLGFLSQENSAAGMAGRSGIMVKSFNC